MNRAFRKYHRTIAMIVSLPLAITVLTGMATTMVQQWSFSFGISRSIILQIHTGKIFHLEGIYPILNGLGLIGLLVTGLTMTGLFRGKAKKPS
ncbi:hypothetical protein [Calothrix sp. PCC 6303]|uniref:hypothetical protein n=1 Tax=Calothrix sp. PCC 6303 TaxID=1170562 RepID=UPI0002A0052F|nr:hypothetical protein [Calothrix sp. PCC 6303]AFY99988.1 hypothetical protein Cal6303_0924 [Calothrix sp. PCC 6303]